MRAGRRPASGFVPAMLHSAAGNVAFAHYPKTAGHSLVAWFRDAFPDAAFVEPPAVYTISHLGVPESLERLGLVAACPRTRTARRWRRLVGWLPGRSSPPADTRGLRIIGVVREPLEMLVSLFEYWRVFAFARPPDQPLIASARRGSFRDFLTMAVVDGHVRTYDDFFGVGGPAWPDTRLLAFESLGPALDAVCREFGLPAPASLSRHNAGPRPARDLACYRQEAGSLIGDLHRRFAWYYDEGMRVMVRGDRATGPTPPAS